MRRIGALCAAALLALTLGGCGTSLADEAYRGKTVVGTVTAVEGSTVTLQVDMTGSGADAGPGQMPGGDGAQPPAMPDGSSGTDGKDGTQTGEGETQAGQDGTQAAQSDGQSGQPPALPSDAPSGESGAQMGEPPAKAVTTRTPCAWTAPQ